MYAPSTRAFNVPPRFNRYPQRFDQANCRVPAIDAHTKMARKIELAGLQKTKGLQEQFSNRYFNTLEVRSLTISALFQRQSCVFGRISGESRSAKEEPERNSKAEANGRLRE